ncbi:hypothetical protein CPAR01_06765 [Colletotrichum paranaense]|uniref:Uncharacterized protein n=1 Tax=Colletotrichum paranaense TaxID=1914294 RepID=A0ABQ9SMP0_9PEZI|nr:uncharacterized protein CPAR01_06765 [Colletotrichum paranaense]KAK1540776.1 hypothetical protein CPAR01_06765 [Colletotrichum paranaense]
MWRHVEWLNSHELSSWSTAMFKCCPTGQLFIASIGRLCMRPVLLAAVRSSNPSRLPGAQPVVRRNLQNVRLFLSEKHAEQT